MSGKPGPRPHLWKVQGEVPHQQYIAFLRMRAQANFRRETFELTFEQFQDLWRGLWDRRGRGSDDFCLTREDQTQKWCSNNTVCIRRTDHLRKQRQLQVKQNGKLI
jgi:hypothetical protein